jgi:hypothetical protein
MPLERSSAGEQLLRREILTRPLRGRDKPERDRRRARAETPRAWDPLGPRERHPLRRSDEPERSDADVARVGFAPSPSDTSSSFHRSSATAAQS